MAMLPPKLRARATGSLGKIKDLLFQLFYGFAISDFDTFCHL